MIEMAMKDGIHAIVCTPHWLPGMFDTSRLGILKAVEQLQGELQRRGMNLQLYPGAELRLDPSIPKRITEGDILTLNDAGRYALIELPESVVPQHLEHFFWELRAHNVIPILCHPERNFTFLRTPMLLWRLVEMGALVQITSGSLLGRFGGKIREFSTLLIKHRMVHVIASDAHSANGRTPRLRDAFLEAEKLLGTEAAEALVRWNPGHILEGCSLELPTPIPLGGISERASLLTRFLSRIRWKRP
jgi:protein-tyrosine phosphatase